MIQEISHPKKGQIRTPEVQGDSEQSTILKYLEKLLGSEKVGAMYVTTIKDGLHDYAFDSKKHQVVAQYVLDVLRERKLEIVDMYADSYPETSSPDYKNYQADLAFIETLDSQLAQDIRDQVRAKLS